MALGRIDNLRSLFAGEEIDALLVSKPVNVAYLSGFSGTSAFLLVTRERAVLITDFRYLEQAREQVGQVEIMKRSKNMADTIREALSGSRIVCLGFESEHVSYKHYESLSQNLNEINLVPVSGLPERLRLTKTHEEVKLISTAAGIADSAFEYIIGKMRPGVQEREISAQLEYYMRTQGASKSSFDIIVASGYRGALPHGVASDKRLESGDMVVLDFGAIYRGYCSDMTRTVVLGKADPEQRRIYEIVLNAQEKALKEVAEQKICSEIDALARGLIRDEGYGDNFGHGLGHGVGMEVHEGPVLNAGNNEKLSQGMVATVEPGIYIEGWSGVRIEDMVAVEKNGSSVLTRSTKELIEL